MRRSRGLAFRRHCYAVRVIRERKKLLAKGWHELRLTPRFIGLRVSTHGRPCSCGVCRPERFKAARSERRARINEEEQVFAACSSEHREKA